MFFGDKRYTYSGYIAKYRETDSAPEVLVTVPIGSTLLVREKRIFVGKKFHRVELSHDDIQE